jgi:hypothetical protein
LGGALRCLADSASPSQKQKQKTHIIGLLPVELVTGKVVCKIG